jgi:hypothetical protein
MIGIAAQIPLNQDEIAKTNIQTGITIALML